MRLRERKRECASRLGFEYSGIVAGIKVVLDL